jgi:predicted MFS family arabinose efflux permease
MTYAFLMGGGIAATTYFLPLYAHERLGYSESSAGIVLSAIGLTGIASRIAVGSYANRIRDESRLLIGLAAIAIVALAFIWAAEAYGIAYLWIGAFLLGGSAVAWNAVAMLVAVRHGGFQSAGRATANVSLAFFGGLILSPTTVAFAIDRTGTYGAGWLVGIAHFSVALAVAAAHWRSRLRQLTESL